VAFRKFQAAELRVDSVVGEFYWRVQAGERVHAEDYIAPPAMLSREVTASEQNWSLSSYLTAGAVNAAFGTRLALPAPIGVAPNQPYPAGIGKVMALAITALFAVGVGKCASAPGAEKLRERFTVAMAGAKSSSAIDPTLGVVPPLPSSAADPAAGGDAADPNATVKFSSKFALDGGRNIAFELTAGVVNNWAYAVVDLINDDTGSVVSFDKSIEYYSGYDADGGWTEGSATASEVIGPVQAGSYLLRIEAQHGGVGGVELTVVVRQGVFRWTWFWLCFGVLALPFGIVGLHAASFRRRRWSTSNAGRSSTGPAADRDSGDDDDD